MDMIPLGDISNYLGIKQCDLSVSKYLGVQRFRPTLMGIWIIELNTNIVKIICRIWANLKTMLW